MARTTQRGSYEGGTLMRSARYCSKVWNSPRPGMSAEQILLSSYRDRWVLRTSPVYATVVKRSPRWHRRAIVKICGSRSFRLLRSRSQRAVSDGQHRGAHAAGAVSRSRSPTTPRTRGSRQPVR